MSLVWMDGFEGYGTRATNPSVQLARRYAVGDTQYFSIVAGRTGGYAVKSVNGSYYFQTPALTTNGTMIVSFGYRTDYAIQSYNICFLFDGDTQGMGLALTAGGDIQVSPWRGRVGDDDRFGMCHEHLVLYRTEGRLWFRRRL